MKKLTVILLAAVLTAALFAVSANAAASVKQCNYDAGTTTGEDYYFRGWVIVEGDTVVDLGYRIDDEAPVYSVADNRPDVSDYFQIDPSVVGGFDFHLKPGDLAEGEHIIHVVVKTADGSVLDINNATDDGYTLIGTKKVEPADESADEPTEPAVTVESGQPENPKTSDVSVAAVAAVVCVTLAGAVALKKKK